GALAEFRETARLAPSDPEAHYNLGMALKNQGDLEGATQALRDAVALKPDYEKARYNLGILLRAQGQQKAGEAELRQGEALQQFRLRLARAKNLTAQGAESLKNGNADEALELLTKALMEYADLPTTYYLIGSAWSRKGNSSEALTAYRKALELKPDYAQAHSGM